MKVLQRNQAKFLQLEQSRNLKTNEESYSSSACGKSHQTLHLLQGETKDKDTQFRISNDRLDVGNLP